jgi:hypothetical protein
MGEWQSLKELIKTIQKMPQWSFGTKYLNIRLDTRYINNDYGILIKDDKGNILSINDIIEQRKVMNKE